MKWLKKVILCFVIFIPTIVDAGILNIGNLKTISKDKYSFTISVKDMEINYLKGNLVITNGTIDKITMSNGWVNKTGNNNSFYFYRSGTKKGEYTIATVEVVMTGDSEYSGSNLKFGKYTCSVDNYGNYFGEEGTVVNETTYKNTCGKSKDATLKSLVPSIGNLSPKFSSNAYVYTLTIDSDINVVNFAAVTNDTKAKIKSGTSCQLKNYLTNCNIEVESESGNINTYSIAVIRETYKNPSGEIKNFKVINGTLNKTFNQNVTSYDLTPSNGAETIYFKFEIDGVSYTSNPCSSISSSCNLTVTTNGVNKKYVFTVIQEDKDENEQKEEVDNKENKPSEKEENKNTNKENNKPTNKEENNKNQNQNNNNNTNEDKLEETTDNGTTKEEQEETKEEVRIPENNNNNNNSSSEHKKKNIIDKIEDKNKFLIILCLVNVFFGVLIGQFVKKRTNKK